MPKNDLKLGYVAKKCVRFSWAARKWVRLAENEVRSLPDRLGWVR